MNSIKKSSNLEKKEIFEKIKKYEKEFRAETYKENLQREVVFSLALIYICFGLMFLAAFECYSGVNRMNYVIVYGGYALFSVGTYFAAKYFSKREICFSGKVVEILFVVTVEMVGIMLALSDVKLSNQVNAYVVVVMTTGAIFYFKRHITLMILAFSHILFLVFLSKTIGMGVTFLGFAVNTTVMLIVSFILSRAVYYLYLSTFIAKKELAIEKEKAEAASSIKGEFISNMSHEIRTPLNAIIGFGELLKDSVSGEREKGFLKAITTGGEALLAIINDILDLSKIEAGKMAVRSEPADIRNITNEIRHLFSYNRDKKEIELLVEVKDDVPATLLIDEVRIRQILFNLVGNAIKFTSKGYVKVTVQIAERCEGKATLVIEVKDTGIGIKEAEQKRIFDPFVQQNGQSTRIYGGTGLGLTITKKLVEMMNGRIELESEFGKGSLFRVIIKDIDIGIVAEAYETGEIFREEDYVFQNTNILYAEDVETNRKIFHGYMEKYGFVIDEAENGIEAVKKAKKNKPDLIFMDIHMPVLDGIDAAKLIKSENELCDIPMIALTAKPQKDTHDDDLFYFDEFLEKPISRRKLFETIVKYVPHIREMPYELEQEEIKKISEIPAYEIERLMSELEKSSHIIISGEIIKTGEMIEKIGERYSSELLKVSGFKIKKYAASENIEMLEKEIFKLEEIIKANKKSL